MPGIGGVEGHDDLQGAVQQMIFTSSGVDYIDQLIPLLEQTEMQSRVTPLLQALNQVSSDREAEIERICNSNHTDFINSVNKLQSVREGSMSLTSEIVELARSIETSTAQLAEQKKALVDSRGVRQNIDDAMQALRDCLEVLRVGNQVHELLGKKKYYEALRALEELQSSSLRGSMRYSIADSMEKSVPATHKMLAEAVMTDLNTWLFHIRETSQFLGEVAFFLTEQRRDRQKQRIESNPALGFYGLNSAVELVADEPEEFDVLMNEDVQVDFTPLLTCLHIHNTLGQTEKFRADYAATRRRQKDLLLPQTLNLLDQNDNPLSTLLESIAGFAIVEKATMIRVADFRSQADVDDLWDSMCQAAISLVSASLPRVDSDEDLLQVKGVITSFTQTMEFWGYSVNSLDGLVLTIFEKYASILRNRFGDDLREIVQSDDYMPMTVNGPEDYNKVVNVSWYVPPEGQQEPEQLSYPFVLPFSQMYPLICIDIRNFLNRLSWFNDDNSKNTVVIERTLRNSLDDLLVNDICAALVARLTTQYPGQIVQILTNLEYFELACRELEVLLSRASSDGAGAAQISLRATAEFRGAKKTVERRIFELVNSKIDDLIETAEYEWSSTESPKVSPHMAALTRYLMDIMSSALLGLPQQIKDQIYVDAIAHISTTLLSLPFDPSITVISPQSASAFVMDVEHLVEYVESLPDEQKALLETLRELRQTTDLMSLAAEGKGEIFFDSSQSGARFGEVDKIKGAELLEKVQSDRPKPGHARLSSIESADPAKKHSFGSDFRDRFGKFGRDKA